MAMVEMVKMVGDLDMLVIYDYITLLSLMCFFDVF